MAETSLLSRLHGILSMGKVRIDGAADDLGVDGLELGALIVELANLSWAYESEIEWPEEKHDILAYAIVKTNKFINTTSDDWY